MSGKNQATRDYIVFKLAEALKDVATGWPQKYP